MDALEPFCVDASLADQPVVSADQGGASLAIALGANLPSVAGTPLDTLLAVRPLLERRLQALGGARRWSPLFRTAPVGGPRDQPDYLNAIVLVQPLVCAEQPIERRRAGCLLSDLQRLEQQFGRRRQERWGPRSLDLDLLWWWGLRCRSTTLELPHPRLLERSFVLAPLAAIDPILTPPHAEAPAGVLLQRLVPSVGGPAPTRLPGRAGWPE